VYDFYPYKKKIILPQTNKRKTYDYSSTCYPNL
jgi:hypothetical protein